ncbi:hypothetical protein ACRQ5Q_17030 [Bradyrhizobium sp. PMVTL-01]|uniref:hypothetical protein n=1 Tax=Bradyrhizobium sp. PMVTL-01 TaxID=3434999 RepID=UPI003F6FC7D8
MLWLLSLLVLALVLVYVLIIRPILKTQPLLSPAFKAEAAWWDKVQAKLTGFRTKLAARSVGIASLLVALHDGLLPYIAGQDWTPITAKVPPMAWPFIGLALAWLFDYLRKITDNPPQVIVQKDEAGVPAVVALEKAPR